MYLNRAVAGSEETPIVSQQGPASATGPFASRVADLVDRPARERLHLMGNSDLPSALRRQRPTALVLGFEGELEGPLKRSGAAVRCSIVRLRRTAVLGRWLDHARGIFS